jgi:hypothetical protein
MKNKKGLIGIGAFVICLWAVVVCSYAAQVKKSGFSRILHPMDNASCSSSGSSSGE